jgi:hypothetical protein
MLWEEEQRQGSISKLLWTVQIPTTLVTWIRVGVPSRVPSGFGICEYRIAVRQMSISERQMDNTARVEFLVESEHGCEQKSERCWRRKIHMSTTGEEWRMQGSILKLINTLGSLEASPA